MNTRLIQPYFLIALLLLAGALVLTILQPFFIPLAMAAVIAVVTTPFYQKLKQYLHGKETLSALFLLLLLILLVLIPLFVIIAQIASEAQELYFSFLDGTAVTTLENTLLQIEKMIAVVVPGFEVGVAQLSSDLEQYAAGAVALIAGHFGSIAASITGFVLSLFIFTVSFFYFLRDGKRFARMAMQLSPLADSDDEEVLMRLERAINSVIRGSLFIAFIQGVLTGIGFFIFGVPKPLLWGLCAMIAALIPGIGTSLVMVPGVLYLAVTASGAQALGLLGWGVLAVGLVDNLLGPKLIGRNLELHPLFVLLSVLGGLSLFGPVGVFLGPLALTLLGALLSLYHAQSSSE